MLLEIFTDGGSRGNPGPAAIGYIAYLNGREFFKGREDIGTGTNNEAEYTAVIRALEKVKERFSTEPALAPPRMLDTSASGTPPLGRPLKNITKIELKSDSRLLVNQVNGLFKVKNGKIKEFIFTIRALEQEIGIPIVYVNIPREENIVADALVNGKLR